MHISHLQKRITAMKALLDESSNAVDNRVVEEELSQRVSSSMCFVEEHQHPLADVKDSVFSESSTPTEAPLNSFLLRREVDSVSLNWRSLRNIKECVCSTPFDHFSKKVRFLEVSFFTDLSVDFSRGFIVWPACISSRIVGVVEKSSALGAWINKRHFLVIHPTGLFPSAGRVTNKSAYPPRL